MKRHVPRLEGVARKIAKGELIGLPCRITRSTDAGILGLEGTIIDETLHSMTLRIAGPGGRRVQVPKSGNVFCVTLPKGDVVAIEGRAIEFRSEDRTKKVR